MNDMMLIVDDVEMNREILKVIFNQKYEILEAENGEEALAILEGCQGSIDIVLLDLMMDGLSGFDILEKRKEMEYFLKIPVVVITGSEHMQDQITAFRLGANEYIPKPFEPEIVLSRVNNVMSSNRRMLSIELEAQQMKIKAELDEMTGLYNKTMTEYTCDEILKTSENRLEVMMILDMDNFKTVNDTLGHQEGDRVIKEVAQLISSKFRKADVVGRIGGDEFCAMMVNVPSQEIVREKLDELIRSMKYKTNLCIPEYVTLSIGVATNEKKAMSYVELFKRADEALYQAKQGGKSQYREYGVDPIKMEEDERPIAMLLSDNRNVCSMVHASVPIYIRIIEVVQFSDLSELSQEVKEKAEILYVDVSAKTEGMDEYWAQFEQLDWIKMDNIFAICEEGNTLQYMAALKSGVADMFTTPIAQETFKRRTIKQFESLGIIEKK